MPDFRPEIEIARTHALPPLKRFVEQAMLRKLGASWIQQVRKRIHTQLRPSRPNLDLYLCLRVIEKFWNDVFQSMARDSALRPLAHEAIAIRNNYAHDKAFPIDDAIRALDTFSRLLGTIGAHQQADIIAARRDKLLRQKLQIEASESTHIPQSAPAPSFSGAKPAARRPITEENSIECYELGKKVWQNKTTRTKAADEMEEKGMSRTSAFFMISAAEEMLTGKTYKRALSQMTTRVFLKQIFQDFGKSGLQKALKALDGHIKYKSEATNDRCVGQRKLYTEFSKLLD